MKESMYKMHKSHTNSNPQIIKEKGGHHIDKRRS